MAAMRADELLARKATEVANTSGTREWADFLAALDAYAKQQQAEVVTSDPSLILRAQGRAQAAEAIRKTISDCRNIVAVADSRRLK
jgi:hypothetical protein